MSLRKCFMYVASMIALMTAVLVLGVRASIAADHRDAPTIDGIPEGDITDIFAFLDPNDATGGTLALIMNVNPFSLGAEFPSYRFATDLLYQFHIDNDNDAVDEQVIQVEFAIGPTGAQVVNLWGPRKPSSVKNVVGQPSGAPNIAEGALNTIDTTADKSVKVFAGQFDDPFVFDVGQFFRINGKADQDVFRGVTSPILGALRGRPLHLDGTSGVDAFGGFNVSSIQIEVPLATVLGKTTSILNIWGTVSRPVAISINAKNVEKSAKRFTQVDRMGQQLFNTVFGTAALKDQINFTVPSDDVKNYSSLIPDSLTTTDNDGTGNTVAGRASLLTALGVAALPNGAPLLPAGVGGSPIYANASKNLLRLAILPDYLRLDTRLLSPNDAPTPITIGAFGPGPTFGYQNGRRPGDAVGDILLLLARQLADIKFPDGLMAGGGPVPGSGPKGTRAALNCFPTGTQPAFPQCPDRRILTVLQGTDFIEPDANITNLTVSGNDVPLSATFPFLGAAHPLPGEPGTVNFPPQM